MLYTLVRKNKIHESQAESSTSERFDDYNKCLAKFYEYLKNNVSDTTVEEFDIAILAGRLEQVKIEHFTRKYEEATNAE